MEFNKEVDALRDRRSELARRAVRFIDRHIFRPIQTSGKKEHTEEFQDLIRDLKHLQETLLTLGGKIDNPPLSSFQYSLPSNVGPVLERNKAYYDGTDLKYYIIELSVLMDDIVKISYQLEQMKLLASDSHSEFGWTVKRISNDILENLRNG